MGDEFFEVLCVGFDPNDEVAIGLLDLRQSQSPISSHQCFLLSVQALKEHKDLIADLVVDQEGV